MVERPVTRDVDAGKPRWRRTRVVKFVRHYTNRTARVAYIRSKLVPGAPRARAIRCLGRLTGLGAGELSALLDEPSDLLARVGDVREEYEHRAPGLACGAVEPLGGALLYALVRAVRPEAVVETGTASGVSSMFLLAALERNGAGRLVSIDLPFSFAEHRLLPLVEGADIETDYASPIPPGKEPGWAVPDELRHRWDLRLGDARELLPKALAELGSVGLFFHDSLHLREHMLFEFETAWPYLADGGILAADDVFQRRHDALPAFARVVGRPYVTFEGMGFIRKAIARR